MSNESPAFVIETPVPLNELDDAQATVFHEFVEAAYRIPWFHGTEEEVQRAIEDFNERIRQAVTEHPILAKAINRNLLDWSLLFLVCEKFHSEWSHPVIKFLIEQNPSALVWKRSDVSYGGASAIHTIAGHQVHCRLMPWIAENYPWVLDHRVCKRDPPVFRFMRRYVNQDCPASDVRGFFQAYPKALSQKTLMDGLPLHAVLGGFNECEASLFVWMADQYPKALTYNRGAGNITVLEHVCFGMSEFRHYGNDSIEIIEYLIQKCPKLVRKRARSKALPIHALVKKCNRRTVQEAVIRLLKAYPESYDMHARFCKAPKSFPFVERIKPLIDKEMGLHDAVSTLTHASTQLPIAIACTADPLLQGVATVFDSWSKNRLEVTKRKLQDLPAKMEAIQTEFEGPDVESEEEDVDQFDEDYDLQNSEFEDDGGRSEDSSSENDDDDNDDDDDGDESDDDSYGDY